MGQTGEPVLVQAVVPEAPFERLNVSVLVGLAWLDQKQSHAPLIPPCQDVLTAELFAVIGSDCLRQTTGQRQTIKDARHCLAVITALNRTANGFMGGIIDDRQTLNYAAIY